MTVTDAEVDAATEALLGHIRRLAQAAGLDETFNDDELNEVRAAMRVALAAAAQVRGSTPGLVVHFGDPLVTAESLDLIRRDFATAAATGGANALASSTVQIPACSTCPCCIAGDCHGGITCGDWCPCHPHYVQEG